MCVLFYSTLLNRLPYRPKPRPRLLHRVTAAANRKKCKPDDWIADAERRTLSCYIYVRRGAIEMVAAAADAKS
jgi:hypothetical protein